MTLLDPAVIDGGHGLFDRGANAHLVVLPPLVLSAHAVVCLAVQVCAGVLPLIARAVDAAGLDHTEFEVLQRGRLVLRLDGAHVVVEDADDDAAVVAALGSVVELHAVLLEGGDALCVLGLVVVVFIAKRRARGGGAVVLAFTLPVLHRRFEVLVHGRGVLDVVITSGALTRGAVVAIAAHVEGGVDGVLGVIPTVVEVDVPLDGVVVVFLGDFDPDAVGVFQ